MQKFKLKASLKFIVKTIQNDHYVHICKTIKIITVVGCSFEKQ